MMSKTMLALCASALALSGLGAAAPATAAAPSRSIRDFTACDGRTDDAKGIQAAFQAAANNAFTLVVDCPLVLHVGDDVARPIFVESGTRVVFTDNGQLFVDNSGIPAFVVANSSDIHFLGWRILYTGNAPLKKNVDGYHNDGQWVAKSALIAAVFNDGTLTPWMGKHRNIDMHHGPDLWAGPSNSTAIFFVTGDSGQIEVRDMAVSVPDLSRPSHYVPMVFSFTPGFNNNTATSPADAKNPERRPLPHDIVLDHIDLDGTLMGFQGTLRNARFANIRSHHYADLQGDDGSLPGGEGKWFAPPHLFYFNGNTEHIRITDVVDDGLRVGQARDAQGEKTTGYALSLKIGGNDVIVDGYTSRRPDGFLDILTSNGLTIRNADATYDSAFLNDIYPGIRFPAVSPGYVNVRLENVHLTDAAPQTRVVPIGGSSIAGNSGVVFENVRVDLQSWAGKQPLLPPVVVGIGNSTPVTYSMNSSPDR